MKKLLLGFGLWLALCSGALAQNIQCPDRPPGDVSNACANTRFVSGSTTSNIAVGTTNVTGGSTGRILYDNAGKLGERTVTGTAGSVVLSQSPTLSGLTTVGTLTSNPFGTAFLPTVNGMVLGTLPKASAESADAGCYSVFSNDTNVPSETWLQINFCGVVDPTATNRHALIECIEQSVRNCDVWINPQTSPNAGNVKFNQSFFWDGPNTLLGLGTLTPSTDANSLANNLVIKDAGDGGLTVNAGNASTANVFLGNPSNPGAGQIRYANSTNILTFATGGSVGVSLAGGTWQVGVPTATQGVLSLAGGTNGATTITPATAASGAWTLPSATDTFVGRATTDTLTNKTIGAATLSGTISGGGNQINNVVLGAVTPLASTFTVSRTVPTGVAGLPTCNAGAEGTRAGVNDSNAASFTAGIGTIVAVGGTTHVPVYCDGTNWRIG